MNGKILRVALIGSLLVLGLMVVGCNDKAGCIGSGECTITIDQGPSGLYIDTNAARSSCGIKGEWKTSTDSQGKSTSTWHGGCTVQDNIDNGGNKTTYGTHSCNC